MMDVSALPKKQNGFTLVEMLTVMLVLVAMASITLNATEELAFEGRYEITKDRYEKIRKAIVGDPNQIVNGQSNIEGFVKDVGRLPFALQELLVEGYCSDTRYFSSIDCTTNGGTWTSSGYGWRAPYISSTQLWDNPAALADGWGNAGAGNYGWHVVYYSDSSCTTETTTIAGAKCMATQSLGKDQAFGGVNGTYDTDYPAVQPVIKYQDWTVDVNGITPIVTGNGTATDICLRIVRNSYQSVTPIPPAKNIAGDSAQHPITFTITNGNAPMGKAIGIIYTDDDNCKTAATAVSVITNNSASFSSVNNNPVCVNTGDHANFTKGNCEANHGLWIDDGTEQYCDLVSGTNCAGTTAPQLGGKEFKRFQVMLTPHTTLPTIYW